MNIGCVVMASGSALRFGSNKLLANFCKKPLIGHILEKLPREEFDKIIVVTRSEDVKKLCATLDIDCLLHAQPLQSDTVRLGIEVMRDMDGCMFCVANQPLCTAESIRRMTRAFSQQPHNIIRLAFDGKAGNPVIFPRSLFSELSALPQGRGGGAVVQKHPDLVVTVNAESAEELADVDTPEMLARLEELAQCR